MLAPWKNSYDKPRQCIKKQRYHFADIGPNNQSYGFSSSHVRMWELYHKEGWALTNWYFPTVVLEKILESPLSSPLDSKEIKPVHSKRNQTMNIHWKDSCWAEVPILWPPDAKSWLTGKDPDAGKVWGEEEVATEDEMVGWHHWFSGHEFEQTLGDSEGQGSLAYCSPWSHKELDTTELLNWTEILGSTVGTCDQGINITQLD